MKYSHSLTTLLLLATTSTFAAPTRNSADDHVVSVQEETSATAPAPTVHQTGGDEYVVIFDADEPIPPEVEDVLQALNLSSTSTDVKYTFSNSAFKGFVASMQSHCLDTLDAMKAVKYVEQSVSLSSYGTRERSPWGLQRISTNQRITQGTAGETTFTYTFSGAESDLGKGVDIYIVDSGVNIDHVVFGGRAQHGFSFDPANPGDQEGHGTHVAGTAAGSYFGVAPGANIFNVKVLGANGAGSSIDVIAGMDWIIQNNDRRKSQPGFVGAIISMSLGFQGESNALQQTVQLASANGIHIAVAAGNTPEGAAQAEDSCSFSPARYGGNNGPVVTVGSTDIRDRVSFFSNNGACNDVYAPGSNILSSYIGANNMVSYLDGTSMACPHVTGIMATLMATNPELAQNPLQLKNLLRSSGSTGLGAPTGGRTVRPNDPQILVNNGFRGTVASQKREVRLIEERSDAFSSAMNFANSVYDRVMKRETMTFVVKRDVPTLRY